MNILYNSVSLTFQLNVIQLRMGTQNLGCHILCLNFADNSKSSNGNHEEAREVSEVLLLRVSLDMFTVSMTHFLLLTLFRVSF